MHCYMQKGLKTEELPFLSPLICYIDICRWKICQIYTEIRQKAISTQECVIL